MLGSFCPHLVRVFENCLFFYQKQKEQNKHQIYKIWETNSKTGFYFWGLSIESFPLFFFTHVTSGNNQKEGKKGKEKVPFQVLEIRPLMQNLFCSWQWWRTRGWQKNWSKETYMTAFAGMNQPRPRLRFRESFHTLDSNGWLLLFSPFPSRTHKLGRHSSRIKRAPHVGGWNRAPFSSLYNYRK